MQTQTETLDVVAEFPATASQQRFWYLHQLNPDSVASNIAVHWELHGDCPAKTIERAFKAIIARHEILRTAFVERDGQLFQQVVAEILGRAADRPRGGDGFVGAEQHALLFLAKVNITLIVDTRRQAFTVLDDFRYVLGKQVVVFHGLHRQMQAGKVAHFPRP